MASTHRPLLLLLLLLLLNLLSTTAEISTSPEPLWTVVPSDDPYAKTACSIALSLFNSEQQVKDRARVARTYLNDINVLLAACRVVDRRVVYIVQIEATESNSPKGDGGWKVTADMSFALPVYGPFQLARVDRESFHYSIQRELP